MTAKKTPEPRKLIDQGVLLSAKELDAWEDQVRATLQRHDKELVAIQLVLVLMDELDGFQRKRVVQYLSSRLLNMDPYDVCLMRFGEDDS